MNNPIDLRTCVPGQKLKSKHGLILIYVGKSEPYVDTRFPHKVQYPERISNRPYFGTRTHDGFVMASPGARLESDHDIVEILPIGS